MKAYLALTAAVLFAGGAAAQSPGEGTGSVFDALDTDKNGSLSQQEAQAHSTVAQNFSAADADGDGSLSRTEFDQSFTTGQSSTPGAQQPPPPPQPQSEPTDPY